MGVLHGRVQTNDATPSKNTRNNISGEIISGQPKTKLKNRESRKHEWFMKNYELLPMELDQEYGIIYYRTLVFFVKTQKERLGHVVFLFRVSFQHVPLIVTRYSFSKSVLILGRTQIPKRTTALFGVILSNAIFFFLHFYMTIIFFYRFLSHQNYYPAIVGKM